MNIHDPLVSQMSTDVATSQLSMDKLAITAINIITAINQIDTTLSPLQERRIRSTKVRLFLKYINSDLESIVTNDNRNDKFIGA